MLERIRKGFLDQLAAHKIFMNPHYIHRHGKMKGEGDLCLSMDCMVSKLVRGGKIWDFDNGMSFDTGKGGGVYAMPITNVFPARMERLG